MPSKFKQRFYDFMDNHPRVDYQYRFLRYFKDSFYFKTVLPARRHTTCNAFVFNKYGEKNRGVPLFHIDLSYVAGGVGTMSLMMRIIYGLSVADAYGFTPVVEWRDPTLQKDYKEGDALDNIFEYYFVKPGGISVDEIEDSHSVAQWDKAINSAHLQGEFNKVKDGRLEAIPEVSKSLDRFLKLNPETSAYISGKIGKALDGKKTLGLQYRGGYAKAPVPALAAAYIEPADYMEEVERALKQYAFERIFIASDDASAVDYFKNAFGDIVVTHEDIRKISTEDIIIEGSIVGGVLSLYETSLEVLTDVYTLAACQGLIAGISSVSKAAAYIGGDKCEYMKFLYKGANNANLVTPEKKLILSKGKVMMDNAQRAVSQYRRN